MDELGNKDHGSQRTWFWSTWDWNDPFYRKLFKWRKEKKEKWFFLFQLIDAFVLLRRSRDARHVTPGLRHIPSFVPILSSSRTCYYSLSFALLTSSRISSTSCDHSSFWVEPCTTNYFLSFLQDLSIWMTLASGPSRTPTGPQPGDLYVQKHVNYIKNLDSVRDSGYHNSSRGEGGWPW